MAKSNSWNIVILAISLGLMVFFGYWIYDIYVVRPAQIEKMDEEIEQEQKEDFCLRGEPFWNEGSRQWQCIDNSDNNVNN